MASTKEVTPAVGAHLVGGLMAPDAEEAIRTAAEILGNHLYAIPDGETGERRGWIGWQLGKLTAIDGIEIAGTHGRPGTNPDYAEFPAVSVEASVQKMPARLLGYADAAEASYAVFCRLREEGIIPAGVRFQVSVPTPFATVTTWVRDEDQERFYPVYADALAAEVDEITAIIGSDLLLQYDVCSEIGALTGDLPAGGALGERQGVVETLRATCAHASEHAEYGVHLCYGDFRHHHFSVPVDLSLCVELANVAVDEGAAYVHMPADRDTGRDPGYFRPLRELRAPRLALGVIDYEGDEQRTAELLAAATAGSGGMQFSVATECGMARIDERPDGRAPSLQRLLELHAEFSSPIR